MAIYGRGPLRPGSLSAPSVYSPRPSVFPGTKCRQITTTVLSARLSGLFLQLFIGKRILLPKLLHQSQQEHRNFLSHGLEAGSLESRSQPGPAPQGGLGKRALVSSWLLVTAVEPHHSLAVSASVSPGHHRHARAFSSDKDSSHMGLPSSSATSF